MWNAKTKKRPNHHSIRLSNFLQFEKTPTYASQIKPLFNIQTFKVQSTIISDALLSVLVPRMARPTSGRRCCGPDKYAKSSRTFCQQEKAARSSSNSHLMMQLPSSVVLLLCGRVRTSRLLSTNEGNPLFFFFHFHLSPGVCWRRITSMMLSLLWHSAAGSF